MESFGVEKGFFCKKQTVQYVGYSVLVKKGGGGRMKSKYHKSWFEEDGESIRCGCFLLKDEVTIALETSGDSLHKRGYRKRPVRRRLRRHWRGVNYADPWQGQTGFWLIHFAGAEHSYRGSDDGGLDCAGDERSFLSEGWTNLVAKESSGMTL